VVTGDVSGDVSSDRTGDRILVGKITGVYGVKGWVKVYSYTEPREGIAAYRPWYLKQGKTTPQWREIDLAQAKRHGKTVIAKFDGCDDRDAAMLLIGAEIGINQDQLGSLTNKEYYWRDLIGLRVIDQQGTELGDVKNLLETGANDVLVVAGAEGREHLIPWIMDHVILRVDLDEGSILVDWQVDWDKNLQVDPEQAAESGQGE